MGSLLQVGMEVLSPTQTLAWGQFFFFGLSRAIIVSKFSVLGCPCPGPVATTGARLSLEPCLSVPWILLGGQLLQYPVWDTRSKKQLTSQPWELTDLLFLKVPGRAAFSPPFRVFLSLVYM